MAISVTSLGTASSTTGTTVVFSSVSIPAGALIVIGAADRGTSGSGSVTDSAGNTYTSIQQTGFNNAIANGFAQVLYAIAATALSAGSITYTKVGGKAAIAGLYATGIATVAPLDAAVTASAFGSSTSPTGTSGSPAVAGELFFGFDGSPGGTAPGGTVDSTNGWTAAASGVAQTGTNSGAGDVCAIFGSQVNAGTGALTYAPALTSSRVWANIVVAFKAAVTASSSNFFLTL